MSTHWGVVISEKYIRKGGCTRAYNGKGGGGGLIFNILVRTYTGLLPDLENLE